MITRKQNQAHLDRLDQGETVLFAARSVDTHLVETRLNAFAEQQRLYAEVQRGVEALHDEELAVLKTVGARQTDTELAIDKLMLALQLDGHPRTAPIAAYGGATPSDLKKSVLKHEPAPVRAVVEAILRDQRLSRGSTAAAQAVLDGLAAIEAEETRLVPVQTALLEKRKQRDIAADRWHDALLALKRGVRAAADDGAEGLYVRLFGRLTPPRTRKPKAKATPSSEPPAQAA